MIKAVIFDLYETLITLFDSPLYFGTQMAIDAGIEEEKFQKIWCSTEENRTIGKITLEEVIEKWMSGPMSAYMWEMAEAMNWRRQKQLA